MGTRIDPYKNFKFRIAIDGIAIASFQELQGITTTVDVAEHRSPMELLHVSGLRPLHWQTLAGIRDRFALDNAVRRGGAGALLLKGLQPLPGQERLLLNLAGTITGAQSQAKTALILFREPVRRTIQQWKLTNAIPMKVLGSTMRVNGMDRLPPDQVLLLYQAIQPTYQNVYDYPGEYAQRFDGID